MHRLTDEASADLLDIWIWLHDEASEYIADAQIDSLTERFYLLAQYPHLGRTRDDDLGAGRRSAVVGEYIIIYSIEDSDVLILRVIHGRRDIKDMFGE